jgi:hypothetical protein
MIVHAYTAAAMAGGRPPLHESGQYYPKESDKSRDELGHHQNQLQVQAELLP